jgi:hypothetical protein
MPELHVCTDPECRAAWIKVRTYVRLCWLCGGPMRAVKARAA